VKKNKKVLKTILVLPLVVGLVFSWLFSSQSQVFAQTASLVATVSINPLTLELYAPTTVVQGDSFKLKAEIGNRGQSKVQKVEATIFTDSGLIVRGKETKKVGMIKGGDQKDAAWRIKAQEPGFYLITIEVRGKVAETGDWATKSRTTKVTVITQTSLLSRLRRFLFRA